MDRSPAKLFNFDLNTIEGEKELDSFNYEHSKLTEREIRAIKLPKLTWGNSAIQKELFHQHIIYIEAFTESNSIDALLNTLKLNSNVVWCGVTLPKDYDPFRQLTQFFHYVKIGDLALKEIEQLLINSGGYHYFENDIPYTTPLALAATYGQINTVELLLKYGANPNKKNPKQEMSALSIAAREGHELIVEKLLEAGADINSKDDITDRTPLMNAVIFGHMATIEKLLLHAANPSIKNKYGFNALDYASTPEIKELLQCYNRIHNPRAHISCDIIPWDETANMTAIINAIQALKVNNSEITIGKIKPTGYGVQRLQIFVETDSQSENEVLQAIAKSHDHIMEVQLASHTIDK